MKGGVPCPEPVRDVKGPAADHGAEQLFRPSLPMPIPKAPVYAETAEQLIRPAAATAAASREQAPVRQRVASDIPGR